MNISIIGSEDSGKDLFFEILSEGKYTKSGKNLIGSVNVPDPRIDILSDFFKPKKTIYAKINFKCLSIKPNLPIEDLRTSDELIIVLKYLENGINDAESVVAEFNDIIVSLQINDLEIIENYIKRHEKEPKSDKDIVLLNKIKEVIEKEQIAENIKLFENDLIRGLGLVSVKQKLVVLNIPENLIKPNEIVDRMKKDIKNYETLTISIDLEKEIVSLDLQARLEMFKAYSIEESSLDVIIKKSFELLNLITFFTVGEDEVRGWILDKGSNALEAAGKIHSDIQRGFIRAETINYTDFLNCSFSFKEAKEKGLLKLEGKEYVVKHGDIMHFRFNV